MTMLDFWGLWLAPLYNLPPRIAVAILRVARPKTSRQAKATLSDVVRSR